MNHAIRVVAVLACTVTGCALQRAQIAHVAQAKMIGLNEESVLRCMGPPAQRMRSGATEVWTYSSGNGATTFVSSQTASAHASGGTIVGNGSSIASSSMRYCIVNVVMANGAVAQVNYSGPTGGIVTEGEQCAFAVRNCVQ